MMCFAPHKHNTMLSVCATLSMTTPCKHACICVYPMSLIVHVNMFVYLAAISSAFCAPLAQPRSGFLSRPWPHLPLATPSLWTSRCLSVYSTSNSLTPVRRSVHRFGVSLSFTTLTNHQAACRSSNSSIKLTPISSTSKKLALILIRQLLCPFSKTTLQHSSPHSLTLFASAVLPPAVLKTVRVATTFSKLSTTKQRPASLIPTPIKRSGMLSMTTTTFGRHSVTATNPLRLQHHHRSLHNPLRPLHHCLPVHHHRPLRPLHNPLRPLHHCLPVHHPLRPLHHFLPVHHHRLLHCLLVHHQLLVAKMLSTTSSANSVLCFLLSPMLSLFAALLLAPDARTARKSSKQWNILLLPPSTLTTLSVTSLQPFGTTKLYGKLSASVSSHHHLLLQLQTPLHGPPTHPLSLHGPSTRQTHQLKTPLQQLPTTLQTHHPLPLLYLHPPTPSAGNAELPLSLAKTMHFVGNLNSSSHPSAHNPPLHSSKCARLFNVCLCVLHSKWPRSSSICAMTWSPAGVHWLLSSITKPASARTRFLPSLQQRTFLGLPRLQTWSGNLSFRQRTQTKRTKLLLGSALPCPREPAAGPLGR